MNYEALFEPIKIGNKVIKNRFVMPAMESQTTTPDHTFSEQSIAYFSARAAGGFGLQITDYMAVSPDGIGIKNETALWDDSFIESHKRLTNAIHENGGCIFAQLHHSGLMCKSSDTGAPVKGPSAIANPGSLEAVEAFTTEECYELIEKYGDAAVRAQKAGFDGVEVHGAHFYLIGQFLSKYANKRVDEFGGDYEGRFLFAKLCIKNVREKCGENLPIQFRLSADEFLDGGTRPDDAVIYAAMAEEAGADSISVSTGSGIGGNIVTPQFFEPGFNVATAERIKKIVKIPVIAVGRINDPVLANNIVTAHRADLVALGRQSVCDSEFPKKLREGRADEIIHCAGCMQRCYYGKGCEEDDKGISCILNPFAGKESRWFVSPADKKKKVVVVGAGVAGLEAAWIMAKRGHKVVVYEKQKMPGGNFRLAAVPPHKTDFAKAIQTYMTLGRKNGVIYKMNEELNEENLKNEQADAVILATGAKPLIPKIPGLDPEKIVYAADILSGKTVIGKKKVLILGGGLVGCELAEFMNQYQNQVAIVEMMPMLAKDDVKRSRVVLMKRLQEAGTKQYVNTKITEVLPDGIKAEKDGEQITIRGYDALVLALGYRSYNPLFEMAKKVYKEVYVIGDALKARNAKFAIYEGAKIGKEI
ncbi:MAG TPA: NAD(P)/FAD-dependent oxidoreductase [Candidatus Mediterraneibacter intestinigallinarum]|nr:NAD(P)/FAD-dependent oxidoreductase [Candidatus Mediterraneibacter intestinigallinarum]